MRMKVPPPLSMSVTDVMRCQVLFEGGGNLFCVDEHGRTLLFEVRPLLRGQSGGVKVTLSFREQVWPRHYSLENHHTWRCC